MEDQFTEEYRNAEPWMQQTQPRSVIVHPSTGHPMQVASPIARPVGYPAYPQFPAYPAAAYPPGYPYGYPARPLSSPKTLKTIGLVVDLIAQAIAAVMPLPGAPAATGTATIDEANQTLYQQALAKHAKADERIRTFAKVIREALDLKAMP